MIPATSFLLDSYTALVVVPDPIVDPMGHLDLTRGRGDLLLNRPCDTCDGTTRIYLRSPHETDCPDCDGTGRHTFDIEVASPNAEDRGIIHRGCSGDRHEITGGCDNCIPTRYRVHVIDVLPIYDAEDNRYPEATHYSLGESEFWLWEWDESVSDFICHEDITLPPDAAPGKWLIRLKVHT